MNIKSSTIAQLLKEKPYLTYIDTSEDTVYLKEDQKKYIYTQLITFARRLEEVQAITSSEKGRQEDDLHEIYKKGLDMTSERRERYEAICATFEQARQTCTL